jgi:hypothetical protein
VAADSKRSFAKGEAYSDVEGAVSIAGAVAELQIIDRGDAPFCMLHFQQHEIAGMAEFSVSILKN